MFKLQSKLAVLLFLLVSAGGLTAQAQTFTGSPRVLAEGSYSEVAKPFLAVARDISAYNTLRAVIAPNLEARNANYFQDHAVVFAYLGQKFRGGYRVNIVARGNRIIALEEAPARDSVVVESLTTPFQIAEVAIDYDELLQLGFDTVWNNALTTYKVKSGSFQMTGGFAGITEKFSIRGQIRTWTYNNIVTMVMDLRSYRGKTSHRLNGVATALVAKGNKVTLPYVHPDGFVQRPANLLRASGTFDKTRRKLALGFVSLPGNVADGFVGKGSLKAQR